MGGWFSRGVKSHHDEDYCFGFKNFGFQGFGFRVQGLRAQRGLGCRGLPGLSPRSSSRNTHGIASE